MSIGIALCGGGIKGAAHIGVLQALKEEGINIEYISGTSSGSIVASLYACGYIPFNILSIFKNYYKDITDYDKFLSIKLLKTLFTGKISICGLAKGKKLEDLLSQYFKLKNIESIADVNIPLAIPSVDLYTGEVVYFLNRKIEEEQSRRSKMFDDTPTYIYDEKLADIVRASCSFPAVFEPKKIGNRLYVDGGVRVNAPVSILKNMGAEKVIVVSFDTNEKNIVRDANIISITTKTFDIMGHEVNKSEIQKADYILRPIIKNTSLFDCQNINIVATEGYNLVKNNIKQIQSYLHID
jgi:NTE family protein